MFKTKLIISITIFIIFSVVTSVVKNKTRVIEKKIVNLKTKISIKKNDINESQLDFHYLTSPSEIEIKLDIIGFDKYKPIKYSNIYFNIDDFTRVNNKITNSKILNEKEIHKK
tara:strand:- start:20919 stop:21257 length:339 start_codon:yes stop_codon:yes gene_type:complete